MLNKTIIKFKNIVISIAALSILAVIYFVEYVCHIPVSDVENIDAKNYSDYLYFRKWGTRYTDGYFHEPLATKYGGPREPFLGQLLRVQKIYGTVRRKEDNKPVSGMLMRINKPEIKVLSDAKGEFEFEIYNIVFDTFEIEVRDPASDSVLQVKTVEFKPEKPRNFYDRGIFKDEATIEILL